MTYWIVEIEEGVFEQVADAPGTMGVPEGIRSAELPRAMDLATERWDFDAGAIVTRFSAEEAAAQMWERAKDYRDKVRFFETVPVADVVPGEIIMVECKGESRSKVTDQAQLATWAKTSGVPYEITFTDGSTPNRAFTVNADQVIAIKAAITVNDGLCHVASQAVRAAIAAALEAGATADEIFAIDITAGYPDGPVSPPLPPSEPES